MATVTLPENASTWQRIRVRLEGLGHWLYVSSGADLFHRVSSLPDHQRAVDELHRLSLPAK